MLIITFLATVLLRVGFAIMFGVLVSIVIFLNRSSQPVLQTQILDPRNPGRRFNSDAGLPECPQMKIVQIDGPLFFGAANNLGAQLRILFSHNPQQKHLLILARTINFIDIVGAEVLARKHRRRRAIGDGVYLHQMRDQGLLLMRRAGVAAQIGEENFLVSKGEALASIFGKMDRKVCGAFLPNARSCPSNSKSVARATPQWRQPRKPNRPSFVTWVTPLDEDSAKSLHYRYAACVQLETALWV